MIWISRGIKGVALVRPPRKYRLQSSNSVPIRTSPVVPCCSFSTSSSPGAQGITASERLAGVRFYRILLRQCQKLQQELQERGESQLLLQLPFDSLPSHGAILSRRHQSSQDKRSVLSLFYHWYIAHSNVGESYEENPEGIFLDEWRRQLDCSPPSSHLPNSSSASFSSDSKSSEDECDGDEELFLDEVRSPPSSHNEANLSSDSSSDSNDSEDEYVGEEVRSPPSSHDEADSSSDSSSSDSSDSEDEDDGETDLAGVRTALSDMFLREAIRSAVFEKATRTEFRHQYDEEEERGVRALWTDISTIKEALRTAFRHDFGATGMPLLLHHKDFAQLLLPLLATSSLSSSPWIKYQHQWAIRAYQILCEQHDILQRSSTSLGHDVQISVVSKCIGRSIKRHPPEIKYKFAYRIRIENISSTETIQLLGRTWHIQEYSEIPIDDDADSNADDDDESTERTRQVAKSSSHRRRHSSSTRWSIPVGDIIQVHEPNGGAVGHLPILQPGQAFEYISGTELGGPGQMKGAFYMANVPADTRSAMVGMPVAAFESARRFAVTVQPFSLRVEPE